MRAVLVLSAFAASVAAGQAAHLIMPDDKPVYNAQAYDAPQIAHPWANRQNDPSVTEKPIGEILATRLGLADGTAELFRFRVENAPSSKTMLDGFIDGGGIKLKLSW